MHLGLERTQLRFARQHHELGGLLFGYDTGVISGALLFIRTEFALSPAMEGLVAGIALAVPKDGPALYEAVCRTCHATGLVGAPKFADHAAWAPRIAKGKTLLYEHAIKGFTGTTGAMPPKGGRTDLTDDLIKAGVDYLVSKGQ